MALEGYCAFHHLLLMFLEIYPELKQKVTSLFLPSFEVWTKLDDRWTTLLPYS